MIDDEMYDEWYSQGCPRNESGKPILLDDDPCDYCPYRDMDHCEFRWKYCPEWKKILKEEEI